MARKDAAVPKSRSKDRHKKRKTISLFPPLHEQLQQLAKKNDRPVQWELRRAVAKYLEENGIAPRLPPDDVAGEDQCDEASE